MIEALDHVQLAMPSGGESEARVFHSGLLGIPEVAKPPHLAERGGCWFERTSVKAHRGVEKDFRSARKAHPAFRVADLAVLRTRLTDAGFSVTEDEPLAGYERGHVDDPFGNHIELMKAL